LHILSLQSIQSQQWRLLSAAKKLATADSYSFTDPQKTIEGAMATIMSDPSSAPAGTAIASIWQAIPAMAVNEATSTLELVIQHQSIMLTNHAVWKWLDIICKNECWDHLQHRKRADTWMNRLTDKIDNLVDAGCTSLSIASADYLPDLPAKTYQWTRSHHTNLLLGNRRHTFIYETILSIVQGWLGYPKSGMSRAQATFVDESVKLMGMDVLLLDTAWESYCKIKTNVIGDAAIKTITDRHFTNFRSQLPNHPLCNLHSAEAIELQAIGNLMAAFRNWQLSSFMFPELHASASATITNDPHISSSAETSQGHPGIIWKILCLTLIPLCRPPH